MVVTATGGGVSQFLEAELDRNATMVQVRVRLATPVSALWRHIGIPLATCHSLDSSRRVSMRI
ncbi:hypothetical protein FRC02_009607 [Tulasnella sp. 418]|nr:hypothetical protein FRC02_009607 [Tulasnella sp. 418]